MKNLLLAFTLLFTTGNALAGKAPSWSLKTPGGETVNFPADAQGQPTVIMFWPSWCPFSRALQPYVQDIWDEYKSRGVKVWTINIKEDRDPVAVMKERGLSFPLVVNGDEAANDYGLQYTPWLVVVDQKGEIVYTRPPKPPTPVHTAKEVRELLNKLIGPKQAVPIPAEWAKPYDLHLKDKKTLNKRLTPVDIDPKKAKAWVEKYLAAIPPGESVKDSAPRGAIDTGKAAIGQARELWGKAYGEDETREQAPYRAYRQNNYWVVLGDGLSTALGGGFIAVFEVDSGRVVRLARSAKQPP